MEELKRNAIRDAILLTIVREHEKQFRREQVIREWSTQDGALIIGYDIDKGHFCKINSFLLRIPKTLLRTTNIQTLKTN